MEISVDQLEKAKEASQKWKYSNERTSLSWRKVKATTIGSSVQKIDRVESWEGAVMIVHVLSLWFASLLIIFAWKRCVIIYYYYYYCYCCCYRYCYYYYCYYYYYYYCYYYIQIRQWYWTWKAFLSIKNYFYQGESETCPISEIVIIILFLKFITLFEAAAFSFTNLFLKFIWNNSYLYCGCGWNWSSQ